MKVANLAFLASQVKLLFMPLLQIFRNQVRRVQVANLWNLFITSYAFGYFFFSSFIVSFFTVYAAGRILRFADVCGGVVVTAASDEFVRRR